MRPVQILILLALGSTITLTAVALGGVPRIQWEEPVQGTPPIDPVLLAEETGSELIPSQGIWFPGHLTSFSLADTTLYAFYLEAPGDLETLVAAMTTLGGPSALEEEFESGDLSSLLARPGQFERLDVGANGELTPMTNQSPYARLGFLAVVNAVGDLLGSRVISTDASPRQP